MRAVFMGTPQFAADILTGMIAKLPEGWELCAVYTRPDAVRGRGKQLVPSPVKEVALRAGIPVLTPKTLKDLVAQQELAALAPDVLLVAAYGLLLPQAVLDIPRFGCFNAHASLLPRWRGAAPVERAILAGDEQAGVCVMKMEAGLDTGDFAYCQAVSLSDLSAQQALSQLAPLAVNGFCQLLGAFATGATVPWEAQDEALVTYAHKLEKGELDLFPEQPAVAGARKVRASSEGHPSKCLIDGARVAVVSANVADWANVPEGGVAPGEALFFCKRLLLGTEDGALEVTSLKPEGKREMEARAFCAGRPALRGAGARWDAVRG